MLRLFCVITLTFTILASSVRSEEDATPWAIRVATGIGLGIPVGKEAGDDTAPGFRLATDVRVTRSLVLRVPVVSFLDGALNDDGSISVRASIGPLFRSRLSKNPRYPSEFYFYAGAGAMSLSRSRGGESWPLLDLSVGIQPALASWFALDVAYDLPLLIIASDGTEGAVISISGPRFGVVFSI